MNIVLLYLTFNIIQVDAFVALGGLPSKEGYISKNTLIEIIKVEFELTIDMEVITTNTTILGIFEKGRWRH